MSGARSPVWTAPAAPAALVNGRQWSLPLTDRVPMVATYYRTNLTMRQLAPLFGVKTAPVHRIIDRLGSFLALAPARKKYGPDTASS